MKRIIVTKNIVDDLYGQFVGSVKLPILLIVVLSIFLSGCEGAKPKQRQDTNQPSQIASTKTNDPDTKIVSDKPISENKPQTNTQNPKDNKTAMKTETPKTPQEVEPKKPETLIKAEVGAGAKGHYGGEKHVMAPLLVPLGTYWRASEMTTYNIKIPKAMQLYKATHENKAPATHEEFMEEIIKKEMIKLPTLPAGHRYVYDPADEQLKIAKPTN